MDNDTPGLGHNRPPVHIELAERARSAVDVAEQLVAKIPEITNEAEADKVANLMKRVQALKKEAAEALKEERRPIDEALKELRGHYDEIAKLSGHAYDILNRRINDWLTAQRQRKEEEARRRQAEAEAARRAEEEARRKAEENPDSIAAKIAAEKAENERKEREREQREIERQRVTAGTTGTRAVHQRTTWRAEVDDWKKAMKHFGKDPGVAEAIKDVLQKAADAWARRTKGEETLEGVRAVSETKATG